jgi:hypothetical protein
MPLSAWLPRAWAMLSKKCFQDSQSTTRKLRVTIKLQVPKQFGLTAFPSPPIPHPRQERANRNQTAARITAHILKLSACFKKNSRQQRYYKKPGPIQRIPDGPRDMFPVLSLSISRRLQGPLESQLTETGAELALDNRCGTSDSLAARPRLLVHAGRIHPHPAGTGDHRDTDPGYSGT